MSIRAFGLVEFLDGGMQRGVARQEDRAAIVERFGGNIVRADFLRGIHDFDFVVAHERAVERHAHGGADGGHIVQRLRSDLAQAVPGDQAERAVRARDALGDAQHHAAIEQDAEFLRRARHNFPLDGLERHQVKLR